MRINPYSTASQIIGLMGGHSEALADARVQQRSTGQLNSAGKMAAVPLKRTAMLGHRAGQGLPSVRMKGAEGNDIGIGSTSRSARHQPFAEVPGIPSMRLVKTGNRGVMTIIDRQSKYADFMTKDEMKPIQELADRILRESKGLSQGPLSMSELARRGHPYGYGRKGPRGRRRGLGRIQKGLIVGTAGISNMAVVNRQSGKFQSAWKVDVRRDKNGIHIDLSNDSKVAQFLAFGTAQKKTGKPIMRPHGPFTTIPAKHLAELDRIWRKQARVAWARSNAIGQMG